MRVRQKKRIGAAAPFPLLIWEPNYLQVPASVATGTAVDILKDETWKLTRVWIPPERTEIVCDVANGVFFVCLS